MAGLWKVLQLVMTKSKGSVSAAGISGIGVSSTSDLLHNELFIKLITMVTMMFALTALAIWMTKTADKLGSADIKGRMESMSSIYKALIAMGVALLGVGLVIKALQSDVMSIQDIDLKFIEKIALLLGTLVGLIACAAMVAFIANRTEADEKAGSDLLVSPSLIKD